MVNPTLIYKEEEFLVLNHNAKKLFKVIYEDQNKAEHEEEDIPRIKVSELISKMSFYYEKIRNSVDYKEEYLLRKNAIMRILKRQLMIEGGLLADDFKGNMAAKHLLIELIRAAYLPNNKISENKIDEIAGVIEKYVKLRKYSIEHGGGDYDGKNELTKWIITMASCDIEERLGRSKIENLVINSLQDYLSEVIHLRDNSEYKDEKEIQIYIAIQRLFLRFDNDLTSFVLFKYYNSNWRDADNAYIEEVSKSIIALRESINLQLEHPLSKQINKIVKRYSGYYSILIDTISNNPVAVYDSIKSDPKAFSRDVKMICEKRYKSAKSKLRRAAFRSMIYIFLTKSIFAVILEVPVSRWFGEEFNPVALGINITFPALLLFVAYLLTKLPSEANTKKIIEGVNEIAFEGYERKDPILMQKPAKRSIWLNAIFGIIYTFTFLVSTIFIIWTLDKVGFNWVSITIFLFFLAFVSFFNLRIRKNIKELIVIEQKESIINLLMDFFYIPIVAVGKWLSEKFARVNIFVFIMDFIIEAPFKIFVEIAEEWTKYVRERKEDIA